MLLETRHWLKLPELSREMARLHLAGGSWLLEVGPILLSVFWSAFDHDKLEFVDL